MIKRHYDKIMMGCCFLFLFANLGIASTGFSVHLPFMVAIEGVGDTGGSLVLSVRTGTSLLAITIVDRYYSLLNIRRGVFIATLSTVIGFLVYYIANSLPLFMLGAVFAGLGYGLGGMVAVTFIANRWFGNNLGAMVGFASMGSGFATILMPMLVMQIINSYGLSTAFMVEAAILLGIGLVVFALLRNNPEDVGFTVKNSQADTDNHRKQLLERRKNRVRHSMASAPSREHFLLLIALLGVGIFGCCGNTYISVLATSNGYDTVLAAALVSILGIALTCSKFITGELFDYLGIAPGTAIVFFLGIVGYGLCCLAPVGIPGLLIAGAVLIGVGMSLGSVGISVWSIDLSNPGNRVREIKNFQIAYSSGAFIANTLPGIVKDLTGSYVISYEGVLVIGVVAAFIILRYYHKYTLRNGK